MRSASLSLSLPIHPGVGVGDLALGMSATDVLDQVLACAAGEIQVAAHYPRLFEYRYRESLCLHLDVVSARLVRIDLEAGYLGEVQGLRVGCSVAELRRVLPDLTFDENWVFTVDQGLRARLAGPSVRNLVEALSLEQVHHVAKLELTPHLHVLLPEGLWTSPDAGFLALPPPSDDPVGNGDGSASEDTGDAERAPRGER